MAGVTQPLAALPDPAPPGALRPVEIQKKYKAPFIDFQSIYFWSLVEKITSHQKKQERVLVLCVSLMFLCDLDGTIYRVARFEDIEKVVLQDQGRGRSHVALKFREDVHEPTLLLLLKEDPRNPPECQTKDQLVERLNTLRRPHVGGQSLIVEQFTGGVLHMAPHLGPWKKPPGYKKPLKKMQEYAHNQQISRNAGGGPPAANQPPPAGYPFPRGALVALLEGQKGTVKDFVPPNKVEVDLAGGLGTRVVPVEQLRRVALGERVIRVPLNQGQELGANVQNNEGARPVVTQVDEGTPAFRAGLPVGYLIHAVDGQPTHTGAAAIAAVVRAKGTGQPFVEFLIAPDDEPMGQGGGPAGGLALPTFPGGDDYYDDGYGYGYEDEEEEEEDGLVEAPAVAKRSGFEVVGSWEADLAYEAEDIKEEMTHTQLAIKRAHEEIMMLRYERDTFITQRYAEERRGEEHREIRKRRERRKRSPSKLLARELGRLWLLNCHEPDRHHRQRDEKATRRRVFDPYASSYGGRDPIAGVLRGYRGARGTLQAGLL
eukprot:Hpha_TRINITY_DN15901_c2_g2::TRINITY_DN15901_c2_g2_i1::g.74069::m.74069